MPEGNPLVVDAKKDPDGPGAFTAGNGDYGWAGGIGIAESSMDAFNGIKDGDWVSGGLGMLSLAGEIAGAAIDPFGYLMSSVASFLMEHIQPLKDMLDSVAGNPPVIQSYADTWGNVSKALGERKTDFDNAVKNGTTGWTGAGADAYRKFAAEHSDALSGAATVAGAISTVTMIMGQIVSFVRETVRQLIADLVGKLISWVMEEVFSLGFGTPVVVAQATAAIAEWGKKISGLLKNLTDSIRRVSPLLSKLVDIFEKIAKIFGKVLGKVSGLDGLKVKEGGFVHRVPKGEGGGVHARGHGDGSSGSEGSHGDADSGSSRGSGEDGESAPSHADDADGSPPAHGEDGSPSAARSGDSSAPRTRSDGPPGDGSPSHAGDTDSAPTHSGDSAPSHAGDTGGSPSHAGDSSPSAARSGNNSPSHAGDNTPSHAGDSTPSPTRAGDNPPSHAGDSNPSPTRAPSHAGDSSPSAAHAGDNTPSHAGDSNPSPTRTPSHSGDTSPSPTRAGDNTPSHASDSSPSPTRSGDNSPAHSGSPSHADGGNPAHSGSAPAARADGPGSHAGTDTPSSAAPPRADGTTSASGTAPTAPRAGDPGTQFPSPRGGDGAASGVPPQGGQPMTGGGMPPGGAPGGGGPGGGSPRTGGGAGWTGTPGSSGAHTPHVDAPGRPRTGGDLPEGRPRPRTPDAPAPAARGFGPGTHGPDTRTPGPATRPGGPGHTGPGHSGPGGPGHNGPGGPHDPASGHGPHENGPHDPDGTPPHHGDSGPLTPDEVNARHAESTPSGTSYHAGDPEMGDLPHRVRPDADGRYTVDVHVTPDGHARIGDRLYTPEEFADVLRRNADYDGRPIRLIGCDAGSNDFAHRLSRELDTEVMAPTKPAWTDSHGRVFSSDYEIGPDGRMRPRIPPDGEWNTHHPDGSVHPAGEDGFTPDTHESHKHDIDADDAVARRRPIPTEPVEIETRQPPASMKEKINDPGYRAKYYDGPDTNGEFKRKNREQFDHNDERVEKIREDTDKDPGDRFETKSDDYVPAQYREDIPEVEHKATQPQKDRAQQLIDERADANAHARKVEENYRAHRDDGTLTDELEEQRAAAHKARTDYGEELGEHAASDAVTDRYPRDRYDVKELPDPAVHGDNTRPGGGEKPGAGRFDQIYEVTDRTTGETRHVIVEAKGPNAELGTRKGIDGKTSYEQGHPLYVDSVIGNMLKNGTPAEKALARDLLQAKELGQLDYSVAKARVREEVVVGTDGKPEKKPVYGGYNLKHFDLTITSR
ncbi:hypothetical protein [Amycolatopsis balhimycina]|uniref:hypothetical protein n=1 Tax=Amycolatopsis balhimycina TaxID=208443 RepID=UPI0003A13085|nr:hypothetical protein [Amycolatopsis balhimycina]